MRRLLKVQFFFSMVITKQKKVQMELSTLGYGKSKSTSDGEKYSNVFEFQNVVQLYYEQNCTHLMSYWAFKE